MATTASRAPARMPRSSSWCRTVWASPRRAENPGAGSPVERPSTRFCTTAESTGSVRADPVRSRVEVDAHGPELLGRRGQHPQLRVLDLQPRPAGFEPAQAAVGEHGPHRVAVPASHQRVEDDRVEQHPPAASAARRTRRRPGSRAGGRSAAATTRRPSSCPARSWTRPSTRRARSLEHVRPHGRRGARAARRRGGRGSRARSRSPASGGNGTSIQARAPSAPVERDDIGRRRRVDRSVPLGEAGQPALEPLGGDRDRPDPGGAAVTAASDGHDGSDCDGHGGATAPRPASGTSRRRGLAGRPGRARRRARGRCRPARSRRRSPAARPAADPAAAQAKSTANSTSARPTKDASRAPEPPGRVDARGVRDHRRDQ